MHAAPELSKLTNRISLLCDETWLGKGCVSSIIDFCLWSHASVLHPFQMMTKRSWVCVLSLATNDELNRYVSQFKTINDKQQVNY